MADPAAWIGFGFAITLTVAILMALISIFLYSNRNLQLKIVKLGTYFQIVGVGFGVSILFSLGGFGTYLWKESFGVLIILLSLCLYWMAGRGIKKDDELVKSMDRIR